MSDFEKIKFAKLTKTQKAKADRIMELIKKLNQEGISVFAVSSPGDDLAFVRCDTDRGIHGLNFIDIPKESVYCPIESRGLVCGIVL